LIALQHCDSTFGYVKILLQTMEIIIFVLSRKTPREVKPLRGCLTALSAMLRFACQAAVETAQKRRERNMNKGSKQRLGNNGVITEENVRQRGEYTAIRAVKTMLGREANPYMRKAYQDLCRDIDYFDIEGYTLTSSYDIAQEAIVFLCQYIGRKPTDIIPDRKGKPVTILLACFRHVNVYVMNNYNRARKAVYIEDMPYQIPVDFEWDTEAQDYTEVDAKIAALKLTKRQSEVLSYRLSGKNPYEIARSLSVVRETVKFSIKLIRRKYLETFPNMLPIA